MWTIHTIAQHLCHRITNDFNVGTWSYLEFLQDDDTSDELQCAYIRGFSGWKMVFGGKPPSDFGSYRHDKYHELAASLGLTLGTPVFPIFQKHCRSFVRREYWNFCVNITVKLHESKLLQFMLMLSLIHIIAYNVWHKTFMMDLRPVPCKILQVFSPAFRPHSLSALCGTWCETCGLYDGLDLVCVCLCK